jgi:hypothetical protein
MNGKKWISFRPRKRGFEERLGFVAFSRLARSVSAIHVLFSYEFRIYLVRKDVVAVGGMKEDSQLLNLAIPAPVLDGCPFSGDGAELPRK